MFGGGAESARTNASGVRDPSGNGTGRRLIKSDVELLGGDRSNREETVVGLGVSGLRVEA